jgi:hypothetical protein
MSYGFVNLWKEAVFAYFKGIFLYLSRRTGENLNISEDPGSFEK